jgi:hypothetical protein
VEILLLVHKCKILLTETSCSLDPSTVKTLSNVDDDTITIVMSNRKKGLNTPTTVGATAQALFGSPLPQYFNALTNPTNQAIADKGATSIFITEGANVDNKQISLSPLTIKRRAA